MNRYVSYYDTPYQKRIAQQTLDKEMERESGYYLPLASGQELTPIIPYKMAPPKNYDGWGYRALYPTKNSDKRGSLGYNARNPRLGIH